MSIYRALLTSLFIGVAMARLHPIPVKNHGRRARLAYLNAEQV
jgi:hypothetical protein